MDDLFDCIIIGGGPAGLNAAVVLGRCHRKVVVFDTKQYRNQYSHGMHNYLTRDGIAPSAFLQLCQAEVEKYGVQIICKKIVQARKNKRAVFEAKDEEGTLYHSKKMLIATGLKDNVPNLPGFAEMYGKSVHHCPYCDGWEVSNKQLGVYAKNKNGTDLAIALKAWSPKVTLYTDGRTKMKPENEEELRANKIDIVHLPVKELKGSEGQIESVVFRDGTEHLCDALFFVNGFSQHCSIAETFGCEISKKGVVVTNRYQQTSVTGLYVAGDADKDMHFVVVAAAEGAKAGVIINKELQKEISLTCMGRKVPEVTESPD